MGLLTKPADFTSATLTAASLNTLKNTIYDSYGTTINGQGAISDVNIAVAAAIQRTKLVDTAVVCGNSFGAGTQTITRPTKFSTNLMSYTAGGGIGPDPSAGNVSSPAIVGASQAMAIVASKGLYKPTAAAGADIATITGGSEGMVIDVYIGSNGNLTITHGTANTANTIHLKDATSRVSTTIGKFIHLWYSATFNGTGQWWEV